MVSIIQKIKSTFFEKAAPLPPGLYQRVAPAYSELPYRLHLRIEPGGCSILIINASTVLHLNTTATEFAYHYVNETPKTEAMQSINNRYDISYTQADKDYNAFFEKINSLIGAEDLDPVTYLDVDLSTPFEGLPIAPYRMDCAVTYQLFNEQSESLSPVERVNRELTTDEWKIILKKSWEAGIPHVIFTGGEPTIRPDLTELLQICEDLGQVTGLITNGYRLTEKDYLQNLLSAGLDHILMTFNPGNEQAWESIRDIMPQDVHTTIHLTLDEKNIADITTTFSRLQELHVSHLSLTTTKPELHDSLLKIRNLAAEMGFNLVWNLPVPYSHYNPVALETQSDFNAHKGAVKGWIYVEPDGDVLPEQGINVGLGNLLEDPWEKIWAEAVDYLSSNHES